MYILDVGSVEGFHIHVFIMTTFSFNFQPCIFLTMESPRVTAERLGPLPPSFTLLVLYVLLLFELLHGWKTCIHSQLFSNSGLAARKNAIACKNKRATVNFASRSF